MGVTPEELAHIYPCLYHMADAQSWDNIQKHELLSTSSLLDLFDVRGTARTNIESCHRPDSVEIKHAKHGRAVVRDQKPLIESKLAKSLQNCTPSEWYRFLNKHVFFWLTKARLQTLLCARAYKNKPHVVLTLATLPFVKAHAQSIVLSPMNSGNTQPIAHPRGLTTFQKMRDYPFEERAKYGDYYQVVELAVKGKADVNPFVLSVDMMQCSETIKVLQNIFTNESCAPTTS